MKIVKENRKIYRVIVSDMFLVIILNCNFNNIQYVTEPNVKILKYSRDWALSSLSLNGLKISKSREPVIEWKVTQNLVLFDNSLCATLFSPFTYWVFYKHLLNEWIGNDSETKTILSRINYNRKIYRAIPKKRIHSKCFC